MTNDKVFYIIRHGETDFNKQGIAQGRGVDTSLNDTGRKQAAAFFEAYNHISFDKIYVSSLQRTHQTVQKFIEKPIPFEVLKDLDEISWGIHEGKNISPEVKKQMQQLMKDWSNGKTNLSTPNGESPNEVYQRLETALDYILSKKDEETILMCIHGRTLRVLLCLLTQTSLANMDDFHHYNTVLYIVKYVNGHFVVDLHCNTDHLMLMR